METGMKIGIGIGVAALIGVGLYFALSEKAKPVTGSGGQGGQPAGAPNTAPPVKAKTELQKKAQEILCNKKTPPPRLKKEKIEEYKKCMMSADGFTWNTPLNS